MDAWRPTRSRNVQSTLGQKTQFSTLHLPLLNFMRFFLASFSMLSRCLWMAAHLSGISATLPVFTLSVNLIRVQCLIIQVINDDVKQCLSQYRLLWHTSGEWPPAGLCAADHNCKPIFTIHLMVRLPNTTSSVCVWGCDGRQCWKPCWNGDKQHPLLSPYPLGLSFHWRMISDWPEGEHLF